MTMKYPKNIKGILRISLILIIRLSKQMRAMNEPLTPKGFHN